MQRLSKLSLLMTALALSGCVGTAPLRLADDHPANPAATAGAVDVPAALSDYKDASEFTAHAVADAGARSHSHVGMAGMVGMPHGSAGGAMPGMSGGSMPGMQHGAMPGMSGMHGGGAQPGAEAR